MLSRKLRFYFIYLFSCLIYKILEVYISLCPTREKKKCGALFLLQVSMYALFISQNVTLKIIFLLTFWREEGQFFHNFNFIVKFDLVDIFFYKEAIKIPVILNMVKSMSHYFSSLSVIVFLIIINLII